MCVFSFGVVKFDMWQLKFDFENESGFARLCMKNE